METRNCLNCGDPLKGRADKKFCDDKCRTQYNNRLSSAASALVSGINNVLRRNRRIMQQMIPHEMGKISLSKKQLSDKGFNFIYHTHTYINKAGATYCFCYEYGYMELDNGNYMLVRRKEE
jgi:hypothetical protein